MKYVTVLPFAYRPYLEECKATMHSDFAQNVYFIDDTNPDNRIGIMRAHNMGIDRMRELGADWLIILSAAIRFGEAGGLDFIDVFLFAVELHNFEIPMSVSNADGPGQRHLPIDHLNLE